MNKLSVIILTNNEEDVIEGCLQSVKWADEVIVVDSGSNDKTKIIAKKFTKNIYYKKWLGFAKQRNYAMTKAKNDWILMIDADERVSKKLKKEIISVIKKNLDNIYSIPFKNIFLGKEMQHGGWNPEYHIRLFKKKSARYDENNHIHETLSSKSPVRELKSFIYHLSHRSIEENLLKTREYAILESLQMYKKNAPKVTAVNLFLNTITHFFERYIRAKGYKDGIEGFIEATYQAFSQIFIIQSMLWERQRGKTSKEIYKSIDRKIQNDTYEK